MDLVIFVSQLFYSKLYVGVMIKSDFWRILINGYFLKQKNVLFGCRIFGVYCRNYGFIVNIKSDFM